MRNLISLVLGGGRGTRLYPLTKFRAKPAVPLGGKYRLIDIPISNCINSEMNKIYLLTQFLSVSLHRHIRQSYRFDRFDGGFVEILAAQQTMDEGDTAWYQGTADAVRKNMRYLKQPGIDYVLILSGDQLYRMDYRDMLRTHRESGADVTIAGLPVRQDEAKRLGIMRIEDSGRVAGFLEKPQTQTELDMVRMNPGWIDARGIKSQGRDCIGNMGIYLFNRNVLVDILEKTDYSDFGKEIFPAAVRARKVFVHLFDGYWEDIGTIKAFYEANLSLVRPQPPFDLAMPEAPIYTRARFIPPSRIDGATVTGSLIADGVKIGPGSVIENSIVGLRCTIGEGVTIRNSILMGADEYETAVELAENVRLNRPNVGIGSGSVIEGAIVDKGARIGQRVLVANTRKIENGPDEGDCIIRDGIPVVVKDAVLTDGWRS